MAQTFFELGARSRFASMTGGILIKRTGTMEGILAWARDERSGEYVRVYETAQEDCGWVQGENQGAWIRGNFEDADEARRMASAAYRKINRK